MFAIMFFKSSHEKEIRFYIKTDNIFLFDKNLFGRFSTGYSPRDKRVKTI